MPTEVELDDQILEFPDEMTQDDIRSVLRDKFPAPRRTPVIEPPSTLRTPVKHTPFTEQEFAMADPEYGGALGRMAAGQAPENARQIGIPSAVGISPEMIPSGRSIRESPLGQIALSPAIGGIAGPLISTVGSSVAKTGLGVADYLSSPQGVTEFVGSMSPAKLLVLGKWAVDMSKGAYTESSELGKMLAKENKTPDDWQKISDHTVNALAMAFGAKAVGKQGVKEIKSIAQKLNMPEGKIQLEDRGDVAQEIQNREIAQRQAEAGSPFVRLEPPSGEISMGVRTQPMLGAAPTFEPSGLGRPLVVAPEIQTGFQSPVGPSPVRAVESTGGRSAQSVRLQGEAAQRAADFEKAMAEKVTQEQKAPAHPEKALTENQLRIIQQSLSREILEGQIGRENRPGVISGSALEKWADGVLGDESWRRDVNMNPFKAGTKAAANTAAFIVKGAAMLERGIVDAAQWTAAMVKEFGEGIRPFLNDIRSQAEQLRSSTERKGQDAILKESTEIPGDVLQPEVAPEGAGQVPVPEGRPQAAEARVAPTLESDKALYKQITDRMTELVRSGDVNSPTLNVLKSQLEVVKNRHGGMPPGQTSPARKTVTSALANDIQPAVRIGGKVISSQDKGHLAMAKESGNPEWVSEVSDPANQGFLYKGEFLSREATSELLGEKTPMTTETLREIRKAGEKVEKAQEPEQIIAAALKDPSNGEIFTDISHSQAWGRVTNPQNRRMVSGFITNLGRYVSGKEADALTGKKGVTSQKIFGNFSDEAAIKRAVEAAELFRERKSSEKAKEETGLLEKLEALKFKESGELGAELHALRPDILQRVGRQLWNDAIDLAIFAIRSGKTVSQAIDGALAHIRKTRSGIEEGPMRAELNRILNPERETTVFPTEGENVVMRKSAERATTSEMIPEPVQERIKTAPESFHKQQSTKRVEDVVDAMSESELDSIPRDSNIWVAGRLKKADYMFKRGENDAGYNVFVELEKEGTRLGQLINQFKLLKGTRPEDIVRVINTTLRKEGKDPLNKAQEAKGLEASRKAKDADKALDESTTEWEKNPTPENAAKAEKALLESNSAALELQRFVGRFSPRSTAGIIKSVLQGNLLTPISQTANIVGNMMNVPFRAASRTVATSLDILDNYLTGRAREISVSPVRGTVEAAKGLGRGAAQIPDVLLRGSGDTIKGETRAGLHPIQAWINQFSKNPEMPTTGGKLTLKDRLNLAIEGTFGVPAEAMLRGLGAGDVAFREAARARTINSELELANVPRDQRGFAQKFPELFLDESALKRIHDSTLSAIFQQPSKLLNMFTGWLRGKGEWWDLAASTVAPYKLTPWNIIGEILSYNPLIATAKTINNARIGNRRQAKIDAGKLVVGTALTAAGWWLYKNQLMSPSLDQRDEEQKARILAGEVLPPNHINISGLKRKLAGGDPTFKKGDETRDVFRAGGLAGSMFYMTANIGRQFERSPEVPESEAWGALLRQSTLEQARFGMNQSFLQGVEGLLSAVREGNADSYIQRWGNTVASIPLPNSLTVMSRASREYKPDLREDTFRNQMENIVKNRLGVAGLDDYLPLKRGLWGEPMKETPEGRNAIMYHFFDVFKGKQVTSDPVPLELYRLWRKTTDTRVIPSLPEKVLTVGGQQYPLTAVQQSRYAELVGQTRRKIVDAIVVNPEFHKLPDEKKIDLLDRVYRAGQQGGKAQFWQESGASLTPKPSRAEFQQPVLQR